MMRFTRIAALAAALLLACGCFKYKEELVLMTGGAGKLTLQWAYNDELARQFPLKCAVNPTWPMEKIQGAAAFSRPKVESKDGWTTVTVVAYFEDINKVTFPDRLATRRFSWRPEGDGWALEVEDAIAPAPLSDFGGTDEQLKQLTEEQRKAAIGELLPWKGFELVRRVTMPGAIASADGFAKSEGRTAWTDVGAEQVRTVEDIARAFRVEKRRITCGKSEVSLAKAANFGLELEEAKAAWPKIREELGAGEEVVRLKPRAPVPMEKRRRIAVIPFVDRTESARGRLGSMADEVVTTLLVESQQFRVLERAQMAKVIEEQKLDAVDPASAARIGKVLGVEYVFYGSVTNFGMHVETVDGVKRQVAEATVSSGVIDVETAEVVGTSHADGWARKWAGGVGGRMSFDEALAGKAVRAAVVKMLDELIDSASK